MTDEHYQSNLMRDVDKVLLETFGVCYDKGFSPVAVFLRYLSDRELGRPVVECGRLLRAEASTRLGGFHIS